MRARGTSCCVIGFGAVFSGASSAVALRFSKLYKLPENQLFKTPFEGHFARLFWCINHIFGILTIR